MSLKTQPQPRRYKGTPVPPDQRSLRPEDVLRAFLVVALVLTIGFVVANFTFNQIHGHGTAYFVLAIGVGAILSAVAYRRLEWVMAAFVLIAWLAVGSTPDIATGVNSGVGRTLALSQLGMTFLLAVWIVRSITAGKFSFLRSPLNGLLILYLCYNVWSAINGLLFWDPVVAHFYGSYLDGGRTPIPVVAFEIILRGLSIGAFWLFANNLHDEAWLKRISRLILLPGILVAFTFLFHLRLPINSYSYLLVGTVSALLFAWLLEPALPSEPDRRRLRLAGWIALGIIVIMTGVLALKWVSGGIDIFFGLLYVAFMRSKKLFWSMVALGLSLYIIGHGFLEATVIHKVETSGDLFRVSLLKASFLYAMRYPLGIGPGNFRSYNQVFGAPAEWGTSTFTSAHDFYAQTLSELGFGGLIITAAFVLTALVILARFYQRLPAGWSRTMILGLGGMWAGLIACTSIGDYLIPVYYNGGVSTMASTIYGWIGLGIAFAHARHCGLITDQRKVAVVPVQRSDAANYYPRRMGRDAPG